MQSAQRPPLHRAPIGPDLPGLCIKLRPGDQLILVGSGDPQIVLTINEVQGPVVSLHTAAPQCVRIRRRMLADRILDRLDKLRANVRRPATQQPAA